MTCSSLPYFAPIWTRGESTARGCVTGGATAGMRDIDRDVRSVALVRSDAAADADGGGRPPVTSPDQSIPTRARRRPGGGVSKVNPEALADAVERLVASLPPFDRRCLDALVVDHPTDVCVCDRGGRPPLSNPSLLESHRKKIDAFSHAVLSMDREDPRQAPVIRLGGSDVGGRRQGHIPAGRCGPSCTGGDLPRPPPAPGVCLGRRRRVMSTAPPPSSSWRSWGSP